MNDVTVCGKEEPQAYVTEIFQGDGITSAFQLGEAPLLEKATLLFDTFAGSGLDPQRWTVVDGGGHVSLTSRGLTLGGGQGAGGTSSVAAVDAVEMGGVLLIELTGLEVDSLGEGYFAALASGNVSATNLIGGFHVRPNGTSTVVAPMVLGAEAGATATLQTGHTYTLRLRFHCKDRQRTLQSYSAGSANGPVSLGGDTLSAGADLVLELQETTGGAQFPVIVLYDGSINQAPASCIPVVVDSVSFLGSVASFELTRPGDVWASCTATGSAAATQRLGASAQTSQAKITSTGRMSFYPGYVPASGTIIRVNYRIGGRAVARMAVAGASPVSSLILTAEEPVTRTSADCENAALALLSMSTWSDGAWKGTYACWNPQQTADMWPGDLLAGGSADGGDLDRNAGAQRTDSRDLLRSGTAALYGWLRERVGGGAFSEDERRCAVECMAAADGISCSERVGIAARPGREQRDDNADSGAGRRNASERRRIRGAAQRLEIWRGRWRRSGAAQPGSGIHHRSPGAGGALLRPHVRWRDAAQLLALFQRHFCERSNAMSAKHSSPWSMDMMSTFEAQVLADLSVVKSQMASLLGDGQPGRLSLLEERVERHELSVQRVKGFAGAFGLLFTLLQLAVDGSGRVEESR